MSIRGGRYDLTALLAETHAQIWAWRALLGINSDGSRHPDEGAAAKPLPSSSSSSPLTTTSSSSLPPPLAENADHMEKQLEEWLLAVRMRTL